jgi:hypothetical protein
VEKILSQIAVMKSAVSQHAAVQRDLRIVVLFWLIVGKAT